MRCITLYVTDDLYHSARLCAARRDLSVFVQVRKIFESLRELPCNDYGPADPYAEHAINGYPPPSPPFPGKTVKL